jgi:RND family efflux transporter MFP subunit
MTTKTTVALSALLLAFAALVSGCGEKAPEVRPVGEDIACETAVIEAREMPVVVTAVGSVEPETRVHVSTRMMGWVNKLHVAEGDAVVKGQRLLTIDDEDMKAKRAQVEAGIREAEAVVANAETMAGRFRNLYEAKAVSKSQLDDVETGLERARAGLAQAKAARAELNVHMGYLDIKSPMDGVVTRRMVDEGDMAAPGHPLLFVDSLDKMKIVARLGEKDINSVSAGDMVTAKVTSLDRATFVVEVARLIPSANPGSRTYDIEMSVANDGRLRPGMFAKVDVTVGMRRGIVAPRSAIYERGQLKGLWTVDAENTVHLRWVRLGDPIGDGVEVLTGFHGGETIVLSSAKPLAEGDRVVN